ncbi:MAG: hypothetical protein QGG73_11665, partial [Candidatus Hydrogenedentes bacterium]|nr:hypothetical protein [Candidatus Hydrogenedentota bacterium]
SDPRFYGGKVTPAFPLDPGKERWTYWRIKTTGLPLMYWDWDYMLKGHEWFLKHDVSYVERAGQGMPRGLNEKPAN